MPETYAPVLLSRRAKRLRHETGNWALHAKHEERKINLREIGDKYLSRPARMFFQEPILALITIYMGFVYGLIYLFFFSYPVTFQQERGLRPVVASSAFLGIFAGVLCGCALVSGTIDTRLAPDHAKGRAQEARLILMSVGGLALPLGLFWSAWTSFPSLSPWPQAIAGIPIGFGVMVITLQGFNYLLDCYATNANSALAANTLVRSWFGAGFPLFGKIWQAPRLIGHVADFPRSKIHVPEPGCAVGYQRSWVHRYCPCACPDDVSDMLGSHGGSCLLTLSCFPVTTSTGQRSEQ